MFPVRPGDITFQSETVSLGLVFLAAQGPDRWHPADALLALGYHAPLCAVCGLVCHSGRTSCSILLVWSVTGLDSERVHQHSTWKGCVAWTSGCVPCDSKWP